MMIKVLKFKILRIGGDNQTQEEKKLIELLKEDWKFVGSYYDGGLANIILKYEKLEITH